MTSKDSFRSLSISTILPLILLVPPARIGTAAERAKTAAENEAKQRAAASYVKLPLSFEINQGQTDSRVKFLSRGRGYTLFLTGNEAVLSLKKPSAASRQLSTSRGVPLASGLSRQGRGNGPRMAHALPSPLIQNPESQMENSPAAGPESLAPDVVRLKLVGANPEAKALGLDPLPGKSNYFIGNDPKKWQTNVPNYARVKYQEIYPGVDLVYYGNQHQLEYDFVVAPGADPKAIKLAVAGEGSAFSLGSKTGATGAALYVDPRGSLVVQTAGGDIRFVKPVAYQWDGEGGKHYIGADYHLRRSESCVTFELAAYDPSKALVIDPALIYSTYLGGSGNDEALGIAVDSSGNAYVTGATNSANFPVTSGAYKTALTSGAWNAFVAKLNPGGSALVYSTYLGGSGSSDDDVGNGIAIDSSGNAYVAGYTYSGNFPTTSGAYQTTKRGSSNIFVTELNAAGNGLVYSTYLGGSGFDAYPGIAVGSPGYAYVSGTTNSTNFPTEGAYQSSNNGGYDIFVAEFNTAETGTSSLVYSTYLGGSGNDLYASIAVDSSGYAYVTGETLSSDFPVTSGVFQASMDGSEDAFVAKFDTTKTGASSLVYSTFLGEATAGFGIAVDSSGQAYVNGLIGSTTFPATSGAFQTAIAGSSNAFVAKLNATGTGLVYFTYLGGNSHDIGYGIAVDSSGDAYVTGATDSTNFPTTPNAPQSTKAAGNDAFVAELNSSGSALVYSTYLGGNGDDWGVGIGIDASRNAYVAGYTNSTNFPTANAYQSSYGGGSNNAFVAEIPAFWICLSQTSLAFGPQDVGTTSSEQLTLTNTGTGTMSVSVATTPGFSETDNCSGGLAAGAGCTITVTSTPTDVGTQTGQLTISGAPSGPVVVSLTVQGILTPGNIATLAGGGTNSTVALSAYVSFPSSTAIDSAGNIYVALMEQNQVYKITPSGAFVLVAGTSATGFSGDGGPATNATFTNVTAVALDASGNLYIADQWDYRIRKVNTTTGIITTVAGNGFGGYTGDNGPATSARLNGPTGVAVDAFGDIFIADAVNQRIRVVNVQSSTITVAGVAIPPGYINTVAGNGTAGYGGDGYAATSASLNFISYIPQTIALDRSGNIYIADSNNNRIRVVNTQTTAITVADVTIGAGDIATVAGTGTAGYSGDGTSATSANIATPQGIALDASGNIFFGDNWHAVREVNATTGYITTVAGAFYGFGGDGGPATSAGFAGATGVAIDASGDVLIADQSNNRVRVVNTQANSITVATVKVQPGDIATVAGGGSGGDSSMATGAVVSFPAGEAVDSSGNLYFVENPGQRVREVAAATGDITTVAGNTTAGFSGDGGPATSASLNGPNDVAVDASGNLYIADTWDDRIREVSAGYISTVAGSGAYGFGGDGESATSAALGNPRGVAVDASGNLYIADTDNNRIRKVTAGVITTVAGNGTACSSSTALCGDGGPAASATLNTPVSVAVDASGNLYIADSNNNRIRVVNMQSSGTITVAGVAIQPGYINTVAGNGTAGFRGDGGQATRASLNLSPYANESSKISLDSLGNLFIGDTWNMRVRRVDAVSGIIITVAGNGTSGFAGDGGPANNAMLGFPTGVAVDSSGKMYISDTWNNRIREVLLAPAVTLSTTSLSFSDQLVGTTSPAQTVTVTNSGGANLSIASIAASGDYAQTSTCPLNSATLNPGSTCTISVTFTPTATGSRTGTVTITDNSNGVAGSTQTVGLSGTGVTLIAGMAVSLAPASLVFPAQALNTPSSPLSVTLTNTGVLPVTIYSIVTTPTAGDYAQTNNCPGPSATLAAGAYCYIYVTFTPTVAGSDPGTLTITDNASDSPQSVPLAATYTTPPQPVSQGTTTTFTNGTIMSETVALPSDAVMNGTAFKEVSFIPLSPAAFSSTRLPPTPQSPNWSGGITPIPAQTTCTVISNTGGNCIVIRDLCFDANHNPILPCNIVAPTTPIYLTAQYETTSSPSCPGYIIADDNQTNWANIATSYSPGDVSQSGPTHTLNTDTAVVDLGAGYCATSTTGPAVSLAPLSLVFPAQEVGTASSPLVVTLANTGASALTISNVVTSGDYWQTNKCPSPPATLAVGANCSISVTFTPTVSGVDPGMLTITDNASNSPQSVPLATSTPQVLISPGTSTTFTNGTIMSETVLLPPDVQMNGTAYKAVSFIEMPPAVFSATRLPPTTQSPNWSGGTTPIPNATTCTVIANTGGNCVVIRDLCFDANHNPILPCNIVAPTTPIYLTAQYETTSSPSCPGYIIADDNQTNWANIATSYNPGDVSQGGPTHTLNTDTAVVDLGAGNCATSGNVAPTTTAITSPAAPNGANGWFTTSPVTVILTSTGASGQFPTLVRNINYSVNGGPLQTVPSASTLFQIANQGVNTVSYYAVDEFGNVGATKTLSVKIDTAPPIISITTPTSGTAYVPRQVVDASYSCTDPVPGSGLATCAGPVASGSPIDTTPAGVGLTAKKFTVNATDIAGNSSTDTVNYAVSCHYVSIEFNPSTVSRGGTTIVTGRLMSCVTTPETVVITFTFQGPLQPNACSSSESLMFTTPPFTLPPNTFPSVSFPFLVPKKICAGTYNVVATTYLNSVKGAVLDTSSASLTVQ